MARRGGVWLLLSAAAATRLPLTRSPASFVTCRLRQAPVACRAAASDEKSWWSGFGRGNRQETTVDVASVTTPQATPPPPTIVPQPP
eukprot:scaffold81945_cov63-Phaeocystis_antarctica.AAC.6